MKYIFSTLIFAVSVFASPAFADQERFDEAVELWLDGDDATSLPMMSELANEGFEPAMFFLGRIQQNYRSWSPWITALSEEERTLLITANGDNWLTKVVEDSGFAQTILDATYTEKLSTSGPSNTKLEKLSLSTGLRLIERGEYALAINALIHGSTYGNPTPAEIEELLAVELPQSLRFLQWLTEMRNNPDRERKISLRQEFNAAYLDQKLQVYLFFHLFHHNVVKDNWPAAEQDYARLSNMGVGMFNSNSEPLRQHLLDFAEIVVDDELTSPLQNYCARKCPDEIATCTNLMYTMTGAYFGIILNTSPLQSIIADQEYFASTRYEMNLLTGLHPRMIESTARNMALGNCTASIIDQFREHSREE